MNTSSRMAYQRKENLRHLLRRLAVVFAVIIFCLGCSSITYFIATGAWGTLVSLINAIIEGGPAVIVATIVSIVGANFLLTFCLPIVAFVAIIAGIAYWQTR